VFPGLDRNQMIPALILCDQHGLNPFTKEITIFGTQKGRVSCYTGIDGWVKLVHNTKKLDGVSFHYEVDDKHKPISCTCSMKLRGYTEPVAVTEFFAECSKKTDPWNNMPHRMLRHKAYIQCARLAFGVSGLTDEDEARDIIEADFVVVPPTKGPIPLRDKISGGSMELGPSPRSVPTNPPVRPARKKQTTKKAPPPPRQEDAESLGPEPQARPEAVDQEIHKSLQGLGMPRGEMRAFVGWYAMSLGFNDWSAVLDIEREALMRRLKDDPKGIYSEYTSWRSQDTGNLPGT